jgi:hypothetical protein
MWKFDNQLHAAVSRMKAKWVVGLGAIVVALPLTVLSGLEPAGSESKALEASSEETAATPSAGEKAPKPTASKAKNQIRCWQQGQLILEENNLEVPGDAIGNSLALRAADRSPVYLLDTLNSTCLIKKPGDEQDKAARKPY